MSGVCTGAFPLRCVPGGGSTAHDTLFLLDQNTQRKLKSAQTHGIQWMAMVHEAAMLVMPVVPLAFLVVLTIGV